MYIPPWLLALIVLIMVAAMGVSIMRSFHGFPEYFTDSTDSTDSPQSPQSPRSQPTQEKQQPIGMASAPHVAADAHIGPEFDSYLQQIKGRVGNPMTPGQENLEMISGGPSAPASESLIMGYMPNQEKILPHEMPPQRGQAITANLPTDAGTEAEAIQTDAPALRTVRENVRGDPKNMQGFFGGSPSGVTYVHA